MLSDRSGNPRVSQLQQQRATSAKEDGCFPVDPPNDRSRTENACRTARRGSVNDRQLTFEIGFGNGIRFHQFFGTQLSSCLR